MWDDPQKLNRVSSLLRLLFVLLSLCALVIFVVRLPVFPLREVQIQGGVIHTSQEQVGALLHSNFRGNFFTFDLGRLRDSFLLLPWVRSATVRRVWPDLLDVYIEEHDVLARWGARALVNSFGEIYEAASDRELPVFSGPEGTSAEITQRFHEFNEVLKPLSRRVQEIKLSERRAWTLTLDDGMVLELGREDYQARLVRFVPAYALALANLKVPPKRADLRYQNGFAVQLRNKT
ncbi:MAG: FtsQ-type POTRA domain-containing protein [Betaproteobacteria bacterium]|nr:FtsQ-type POTRA domain-containing protein [Betaproteobacteria bacterium]